MGLKKTNYEVKDYGVTLPEAYAVITKLEIEGDNGRAEFSVQASPRVNCFNLQSYERHFVDFKFTDRTKNPFEAAYLAAKETRKGKKFGREFEYKMPFWDWEDDIVTEQKEE